ncbi:biopolymer transporter ExbD [Thiospirochaeta perfilievii]|uniref:Biopolymer transporter ExbD n=1 Tax=Thiospirochaeta perfilievii TaxID=252967 RepID=A0A5C1Q8A4_9SPIO|nr:biopolymer transporter ExbD [Thiospirochaeta perfilievii]QEN03270.1 biopolymer transporter ExbD [Thiospirochaeta perfilievii]
MKLNSTLSDESVLLITPLIDIMFLILIFFVLNSSFTENRAIEVDIPKTITGSALGDIESHIVLTIENRIFINEVETTKSEFSVALLQSIGSNSNPIIIIEGDKGISYDFLMSIMDRVKVLGFDNISLIVNKL